MEPVSRSRVAFWVLIVAFVSLAAVPSVVLMESVQHYVDFLSGWNPVVLRARSTSRLPYRGPRAADFAPPAMRFVEFKLKAPKAKRVLLGGFHTRAGEDVMEIIEQVVAPGLGEGKVGEFLVELPPRRGAERLGLDQAGETLHRLPLHPRQRSVAAGEDTLEFAFDHGRLTTWIPQCVVEAFRSAVNNIDAGFLSHEFVNAAQILARRPAAMVADAPENGHIAV